MVTFRDGCPTGRPDETESKTPSNRTGGSRGTPGVHGHKYSDSWESLLCIWSNREEGMKRKREEDREGEGQVSQKAKQGGTSYRPEDRVTAP